MKRQSRSTLRRMKTRLHRMFMSQRFRKVFHVEGQTLVLIDHYDFLFPWRSGRMLAIGGTNKVYSMVPLFPLRRRPLCFDYCLPPMRTKKKTFFHRALVLGCGGGAIPQWLLREYPDIEVDVVDMSEKIIKICRKYFLPKWNDSPRLHYHCTDARVYEAPTDTYQFIFCDLFDGEHLAPVVTDHDFAKKLYSILSPEGILVVNYGWHNDEDVLACYSSAFSQIERVPRSPDHTQVLVMRK